jgi:olefin beta-lactone synthetase
MADVETLNPSAADVRLNVADRLATVASKMPDAIAVACPRKWSPSYRSLRLGPSCTAYAVTTFAELDADVSRIARGLDRWGVPPGTRLALLVRPGIEFVTLVFALMRAGMVIVLVDPGLGRRNLVRCLADAAPEGFVAVGIAQAGRLCLWRKFPRARWNVTVGRPWFWGGMTLKQLRHMGHAAANVGWARPTTTEERELVGDVHPTKPDHPAAIIFTSGSTGPPKGVLYTHRMFDMQVAEIQSMYDIRPSGIDLGCFPLFALFNSAMGVTTVLPEMKFSRPASANPAKLVAAANDWKVTQAFASPAVWRVLGHHCAKTGERIPSLRQVFSCGAPVPADVIRATLDCVGDGAKMHTPYGATECLPVATIEAAEVLGETAARTAEGAGVCVGRKFDSIDWRVIRITDEPIATIDDAEELPTGQIGELIVRGPQVSPAYVTRIEANAISKLADSGNQTASRNPKSEIVSWHRTGDVGYLDADGRLWYCGRKSQRVETAIGTMYTEVYEAMFNKHPGVRRSALVGVGPRGDQTPVIILECRPSMTDEDVELLKKETESGQPAADGDIFVVDWPLPVDIRHNSKINREKLAAWAAKQLKRSTSSSHPQAPRS